MMMLRMTEDALNSDSNNKRGRRRKLEVATSDVEQRFRLFSVEPPSKKSREFQASRVEFSKEKWADLMFNCEFNYQLAGSKNAENPEHENFNISYH
jgi:hypothetical protein